MAFKIFVDTNVFLDHLLQRGENWKHAEEIFLLAEQQQIILYTSSSNIINITYVLESQKLPSAKIREAIRLILSFTELADANKKSIVEATYSDFKDLEDAIQYHTALSTKGIEYFVTSNVKDYKKSLPQLPVFLPKQFLSLLKK